MAAYTNYQKAKELALLELIERDAIMQLWFSQIAPPIIPSKLLSNYIKSRMNYWQKYNRQIYIFNLDSKYANVFHVIIIGEDYPYIVSGASASFSNDINNTIKKALQEAELMLMSRINSLQSTKEIKIDEVYSPIDHGEYWQTKDRIKLLSWLWTSNKFSNKTFQSVNYHDVLKLLDPISVDLSEKDHPIKVVRVFSKQLIPINFGYKLLHYTHTQIKKPIKENSTRYPHYFA